MYVEALDEELSGRMTRGTHVGPGTVYFEGRIPSCGWLCSDPFTYPAQDDRSNLAVKEFRRGNRILAPSAQSPFKFNVLQLKN